MSDIRFEASAGRVKTAPELSLANVSLDTHIRVAYQRPAIRETSGKWNAPFPERGHNGLNLDVEYS